MKKADFVPVSEIGESATASENVPPVLAGDVAGEACFAWKEDETCPASNFPRSAAGKGICVKAMSLGEFDLPACIYHGTELVWSDTQKT